MQTMTEEELLDTTRRILGGWGVWCTPTAGNSVGRPSWMTDASDRGTPREMMESEAKALASSANLVSTAWTYEAKALRKAAVVAETVEQVRPLAKETTE